jgi:hypothetical protein
MKTCNWTQKPIGPPLKTGCLESVSSSYSTIINLVPQTVGNRINLIMQQIIMLAL